MAVDCPFCPFSDHEPYFLMQHVELCHPENGESPFVVKEGAGRKVVSNDDDSASTSDASSNEEEYIECECGESVVLRDFHNHTELHRDEGMALDGAERNVVGIAAPRSPPQTGPASFSGRNMTHSISMSDLTLRHDTPLDVTTATKHRSRDTHLKQKHRANRWKNLLLGTNSSKTRSETGKNKHKSVRRLGVCCSSLPWRLVCS